MTPATQGANDNAEHAAFIHREILQLNVLFLIAVATFFLTRALAANNRNMNLRDAAEWYQRGQRAVAGGRLDEAIEAFRRAAVRNRTDKTYVLALARALALDHDDEAARGALLTLRDSAPEDAEVNLELARLAARNQDVTEALRFYHNALYAPWPAELSEARRDVRLELIRFLLDHNQPGRALAELAAASADVPDEPAAHLQVAQLLVRAGDYDHALQQFQQALRRDPDNRAALAGAGRAAFELGRYALARTYLRRAPSELDEVATTRGVTDLVMARDPLANRIGSIERRRRLTSDFTYARQRLMACATGHIPAGATGDESALQEEAGQFEDRLRRSSVLEQDTIEAGVDLVYRLAQRINQACGPPTALDRALLLIGREHGGDAR